MISAGRGWQLATAVAPTSMSVWWMNPVMTMLPVPIMMVVIPALAMLDISAMDSIVLISMNAIPMMVDAMVTELAQTPTDHFIVPVILVMVEMDFSETVQT